MNATELMIGDWVNFIYKEGCSSVKIVAIDSERKFRDKEGSVRCLVDDEGATCGYWAEQLNPIPLTTEILEKNGFRYDDSPFTQGWCGYGLLIYNGRVTAGQNVSMICQYAHQLQHILRLCGMNELADNFKI